MYAADSYEHIILYLARRWRGKPYMCALLFAPPGTDVGRSIFARLMDWHYRSGDNFDFFCVGYGNWKQDPDEKPVATITPGNGLTPIDFYYNAKAFNEVLTEVRARSGWHYSGEADLLLVNVVIDPKTEQPYIDFGDMVALDVDLIVREKVFATTSRLLERICQSADEAAATGESLSVNQFSDQLVLRTALRGAMSKLIETLKIGTLLGARHFIVGAHLLKIQ
jgi:hypothetical protein